MPIVVEDPIPRNGRFPAARTQIPLTIHTIVGPVVQGSDSRARGAELFAGQKVARHMSLSESKRRADPPTQDRGGVRATTISLLSGPGLRQGSVVLRSFGHEMTIRRCSHPDDIPLSDQMGDGMGDAERHHGPCRSR